MLKLTWKQAAAWRVHQHHLDTRAPAGSMLTVAGRLCGLHAQVLSSALLTLWARVENIDLDAVRRALWEDRTLIKTWAMRGTLHLLPASEMALWHGVLSTSRRYLKPTSQVWKKYYGITLQDLERLTNAVGTVLDGKVMTREELAREVGKVTRSRKLSRSLAIGSWGTILKPAAFNGHLCFAPSIGQRVCFTRPSSWLNMAQPPMESQAAQAEVTRRFLAAYGPATYHDLARWWGGGGVATSRQWIALLGDEVTCVDLDGTPAWMLTTDARALPQLGTFESVRLLPAFDQYVVGASRHAQHLLPGDLRIRVYRPQGWISPVLLVNGFMQGTWRHEIKGSRVEVVVEPFVKLSGNIRRAAALEAERLANFLGASPSFTWKN
jgi:hypothetical protein